MAPRRKSTQPPPAGLTAAEVIRLETWTPEIASKRLGPIHDDVNGGYRVGDNRALAIHRRGTFHDFRDGFTGRGGIALIMHLDRCDQAAAVKIAQKWLSDHAGQGRLRPAPDEGVDEEAAEDDASRKAFIDGVWERSQPIAGSPAEKYLKSRGLTPSEGDMEQLHWLPNIRGDEGAMFAALTDKDSNLVAFQETYLTDAAHKSPHPPVRKTTRGPHDWNRTGFVRFGKRNSHSIAICEGVEDALSAIEGGAEAAFALTGISRLGKVLVPLGVSKVIVVRDADEQDSPADIALWRGVTRQYGQGIRDTRVTSRPSDLASEGAPPVKDINGLLRHDAGLVHELLITAAMPLPSSLSPSAIEAVTDEMSRLDTNGYERGREKIAKLLGWRLSALDKARRNRIDERVAANEQGELPEEEIPWEEPITDIGAVLDEAVAEMRRYIIAPDHLFHTTALWALFAHVLHREDLPIKCAPRLAIQSPTTVCGKSTLLEIIACMTPRANITGSTTPASIFREIHAVRPTLLIDEADNLFGDKNSELLGVANSGHRRKTAYVTRTERNEKGKFFVTRFSTWTGIAYAGIRELPETQQNRSIVVSLQRATPEDEYEHLVDSESTVLLETNRKFARFAKDLRELPRIDRPKSLSNRLGDNWYPLRQLAGIAGGEWPQRALDAALGVGDDPAEQNQTLALLEAVWQVFHATQLHRISSRELVDRLLDMDEGRWREAHFGNDITPYYLSRQLRGMILNTPAAKTARQWREGKTQAVIKGYSELHFQDAWLRYLGKAAPTQAGRAAEDSGTDQDTTTDTEVVGESQADDSTHTQEDIYSATSATSATGTKNAEESESYPVGDAKERSATDVNEQNQEHNGNTGDVADGISPFARAYPKGARPRGPRPPNLDGEGCAMSAPQPTASFWKSIPITYCTDLKQAEKALDDLVVECRDSLIAIDIETAPLPEFAALVKTLRTDLIAARGALSALRKTHADRAEIKAQKAKIRSLTAQLAYAETAGLDPHRAQIRLVQLYGGRGRVVVIDAFRCGTCILDRLTSLNLVAHNAAFELAFLAKVGIEPAEIHCTMQTARLTLGEGRTKLAAAVQSYLGIELDKSVQTSDWAAPHLSLEHIEYAATDAFATWYLARKVFPALDRQTSAYEIQMSCIPAVVRMEARGFHIDTEAHAALMAELAIERQAAVHRFIAACTEGGHMSLAHALPETPAQKRQMLEQLLSSDELRTWKRTEKSGDLSTRRCDLLRAAHYPPIVALAELSTIDKLMSAFGPTLIALVSPVTGRIHAHYRVAGTASGRASCNGPNLQQIPRDRRFRALFKPSDRNVLVVGDYTSMELRAAAWISRDRRMTEAFERGDDLHRITAARMAKKVPEDVTPEERRAAKAVNFGAIYGLGPDGLVTSAWASYGLVLTQTEAKNWLDAFTSSYPTLARWRSDHHARCKDRRIIVIGRDAASGIGRFFPLSRLAEGKSAYTRACNLPVQGACADAAMLALAAVDRLLFEEGIEGGPVAWLHDEIVIEVPEADARRASDLLAQAMIDAFAETFPGAPLDGLVVPKSGLNWGAAKA